MNQIPNNLLKITGLTGLAAGAYFNKHRIYDFFAVNALNKLEPENSHKLVKTLMSNNIYLKYPEYKSEV